MALMPDLATAQLDPFRKAKTLNMKFFVHDPLTGEAFSRDPRNVARKAEEYQPPPASLTPASLVLKLNSISSIPSGTVQTPTTLSTKSIPSRAGGTEVQKRNVTDLRTLATRPASREATSPSLRTITSRISATTCPAT